MFFFSDHIQRNFILDHMIQLRPVSETEFYFKPSEFFANICINTDID